MRTALLASLLTLGVLAAGCASPPVAPAATAEAPAAPERASAVEGATKPVATLQAPTFRLDGALAKGGPVEGNGEPSIAASLDGVLYVAFPGCDGDLPFGLTNRCPVAPVFRSEDAGKTWKRLPKEDGKLAPDGAAANNDADVAVDANGSVYVSNLGNGIETQRSDDGGVTWVSTGNVVPKDSRSVDRNWMAAAEAGHVIHSWMGGPQNKERAIGIVTTFDGGRTYSNVTYVGKAIGWEGSAQFAPGTGGKVAYIPYTQPLPTEGAALLGVSPTGRACKLLVARTLDGGLTWNETDTGVTVRNSGTTSRFSCLLMAPALAVTGDGHVVYAYAEDTPVANGVASGGAVVKIVSSADGGLSWSKPLALSKTPSAIFPWAAGGAGDRVAVTYMADTLPGDPDRTGLWDVRATVVDLETGAMVESIVDPLVHQGGICTGGSGCLSSARDRALLDYFENAILPDGRLALVYPADPLQGGKYIEIRTAVQQGGSLLFEAKL